MFHSQVTESQGKCTMQRFGRLGRRAGRMVAGLLMLMPIAGCSYDRTFMQLNSDNRVPFFGFQWSVDAGRARTLNRREPAEAIVRLDDNRSVAPQTERMPVRSR
ncbi:MAG: hypothetical protein KDA96_25810 [Planctomycetaceae bacterium]|nr:hypothetical protein [Planctomycetaceae bacterium]